MKKPIKLEKISLHLYLLCNGSKIRLRFSPNQYGNKSIFYTNVDQKLLRYKRWEDTLLPSSKNVDLEAPALNLIRQAYNDLPFLKDVDRVIIHTKGLNLVNLAKLVEASTTKELLFRNLRIRLTEAIM